MSALAVISQQLRSDSNGQPRVSSRDVADTFARMHKNVLRDIRELECSEEFLRLNFEPKKIKVLNNPSNEEVSEYLITRDGFVFLAMGFTGSRAAEFKEAYISAFNDYEQQARQPAPSLRSVGSEMDVLRRMFNVLDQQETKLTLIETKVVETQADLSSALLTSLEMSELQKGIYRCAARVGFKPGKIMSEIKRRFLPAKLASGRTWKEIPRSAYAEAMEFVQTWEPMRQR